MRRAQWKTALDVIFVAAAAMTAVVTEVDEATETEAAEAGKPFGLYAVARSEMRK